MQDFKQALENALKQSMEKQMNTQSSLQNTVQQWDNEEKQRKQIARPAPNFDMGKHLITTNVSRATFSYIRDNPARTKVEITDALVKLGYNASSVSTLASQMVRGGMATMDERGGITTHLKEYLPIKNGSAIIKLKKKKNIKSPTNKIGRPAKEGIAALGVQDAPTLPKAISRPNSFDADRLLSTLSFADVLVLHKKIKTMLGGV
jgi:hypothetical protein